MKQHAKDAIIVSFKELLSKQSIDKITVKDICANCGVNRQTFYYYFTDIMDIFKYVIFKELTADIAQNRTMDTWEGGFLATLNYLRANAKLILHVYNSNYWQEAYVFFCSFSNKLLGDVVEECIERSGKGLSDKNRDFIVNFYRNVFDGLMIDWFSDGMEDEPEILLEKLLLMISGSIPRSIAAFQEYEARNHT
ncbi:MAG: TetR/AcrR family transcriptional regulator [Oscillospiraceae bacterium]|jgi:probable dihydroxyacetone kinase regulator